MCNYLLSHRINIVDTFLNNELINVSLAHFSHSSSTFAHQYLQLKAIVKSKT